MHKAKCDIEVALQFLKKKQKKNKDSIDLKKNPQYFIYNLVTSGLNSLQFLNYATILSIKTENQGTGPDSIALLFSGEKSLTVNHEKLFSFNNNCRN